MVTPITPFKGQRYDLLVAQPADPAPGMNLYWTRSDKTIIEIVSLHIRLTTSVVVGDRLVWIEGLTPGVLSIVRSAALIVQPASYTWSYYFAVGGQPRDHSVNLEVYQPLAAHFQLDDGERLKVGVTGLGLADQLYGCLIRYFAWQQG